MKVQLEWEENGVTQAVDGYTLDVSPKGCMLIAPHSFELGQVLRLKNLNNQKQAGAKVVWKGHQSRTGWELGLEVTDVPEEFWEVDF